MKISNYLCIPAVVLVLLAHLALAHGQYAGNAPLPDIHELMRQVHEHQKQMEKLRENYTFTSVRTMQDLDAHGQVKKTETKEYEIFFVNSHAIERLIKVDGQPLTEAEQRKETENVTKAVEKAQQPPDPDKESHQITLGKVLEMTDVSNPRRVSYRGRWTIVFDFAGRKDLKAHGMAEDVSKKLQGTVWVDEQDRQVAHLEVKFTDNFHIGAGLLANVEKGSNLSFDQAPVNGEIWLPIGGEGTFQVRILLMKNLRQHGVEQDYDYKRFHVDTQQNKDAKAVPVTN